ncbi:MAG: hypothetical protein J1F20_08520 [Muribaculaceae bacterium]|nr:hypothetical protein [Muribaculaceae bacterium]
MKKSLLLASMALAVSSAFAATDGSTYETINGFTCTNKWINSQFHNPEGWNQYPFIEEMMPAKARTACLATVDGKDVVIVGFSHTVDGSDLASLVLIDFATGNLIKTVQMTCDGEPVAGLLTANQVGCDQFGHVWFAGYVGTVYNAEADTYGALKIYKVDDMETGACSVAAALTVVEDEASDAAGARIDYCDLVGDLTLENAGCVVMCALASNNGAYSYTGVLGWAADQGADKWEPAMDGYNVAFISDTYPDGQTDWGTGPMVRIVLNDDFTNDLFYVDGFTTCPSLYTPDGTIIDSFASAVDLAPITGTNGVGEFALGGKNFIAYSLQDYANGGTCKVNVCELGADQAFEGMEHYWTVPGNEDGEGLGNTSDGGTRIHAVETKVYTDANGKQGAYLLSYKCQNGIAVYAICEEGWEDPNAGDDAVNDIVVDTNAPVQYFNLNGVEMNGNLTPGMYITRQGNIVNKVVVK